jgi:hypothetical protein
MLRWPFALPLDEDEPHADNKIIETKAPAITRPPREFHLGIKLILQLLIRAVDGERGLSIPSIADTESR